MKRRFVQCMSAPTTKGTILRSLLKFVEADLSPTQRASAIARLTPEDRAMIAAPILSTQKVPETTLNHLTVAAAEAKGESLDTFGRRAGEAELVDAVGVYRVLTIVLTPTALLKKASTLWATIHSHGSLIVAEGNRSAKIRLVEFPSEPAHCARLTGWFEGAGRMTRARDARVTHTECMTRGAKECQWELHW